MIIYFLLPEGRWKYSFTEVWKTVGGEMGEQVICRNYHYQLLNSYQEVYIY